MLTSKMPILKSPVLCRNAYTSSNSPSHSMQQINSEAAQFPAVSEYTAGMGLISPDMRVTPAAVSELQKSRRIDSLHWFCCFLTDLAACNLNLRFRNFEAESRADLS